MTIANFFLWNENKIKPGYRNLLTIAICSFYWPLAQFSTGGSGFEDTILLPLQTGLIIFLLYTVFFLFIKQLPPLLNMKLLAFFMMLTVTLPTYSIAMKISLIYCSFEIFYYLILIFAFAYAFVNEQFILGVVRKLALILFILIISFCFDYFLHKTNPVTLKNNPIPHSTKTFADADHSMPDIYYIIPDGYSSLRFLEQYYGYDNPVFRDFLAKRNFYHVENSLANYNQTLLSLASSLNFDYLENLLDTQDNQKNKDKTPLKKLISQSAVKAILKSYGYEFYETSFGYTAISEDSRFVCKKTPEHNIIEGGLEMFFSHTWIPKVFAFAVGQDPLYKSQQDSVENAFKCLQDLAQISSEHPKFVYAHILSPHQPFLNTPDLNILYQKLPYNFSISTIGYERFLENIYSIDFNAAIEKLQSGYIDNINFVNQKLMDIIDIILFEAKKRQRPLILVIQGDHGVVFRRNYSTETDQLRLPVLNAFYFSDGDYKGLYSTISPVNSFRIILNKYFGYKFPLLPDKFFCASYSSPYLFKELTDNSIANKNGREDLKTSIPPAGF